MEIEKLWEALPFVAVRVNAVRSLMHSTSNYYSVSKLIVEEALISNAQVHGVDDENFALIGISLSILNPELIFNIPTASSTESNLGLKRSSINGDTIINSIQLVSSTSNVEERINSKVWLIDGMMIRFSNRIISGRKNIGFCSNYPVIAFVSNEQKELAYYTIVQKE